ncbi:MAG: ArsR/SmtB family transcription factor, partial [Candidatus Latescibacterota bacterium]
MQTLADSLKVLADPARLRILKELTGPKKEKSCCVRDLANRLQISQPNVSHHLKVLKNPGFIACEKTEKNHKPFPNNTVNNHQIENLFHDVPQNIS